MATPATVLVGWTVKASLLAAAGMAVALKVTGGAGEAGRGGGEGLGAGDEPRVAEIEATPSTAVTVVVPETLPLPVAQVDGDARRPGCRTRPAPDTSRRPGRWRRCRSRRRRTRRRGSAAGEVMLKAALARRSGGRRRRSGCSRSPTLSMERFGEGGDARARTVAVPESVPPPGLVPMARVTLAVEVVTVLPKASCTATCDRRGDASARDGVGRLDGEGQLGGGGRTAVALKVTGEPVRPAEAAVKLWRPTLSRVEKSRRRRRPRWWWSRSCRAARGAPGDGGAGDRVAEHGPDLHDERGAEGRADRRRLGVPVKASLAAGGEVMLKAARRRRSGRRGGGQGVAGAHLVDREVGEGRHAGGGATGGGAGERAAARVGADGQGDARGGVVTVLPNASCTVTSSRARWPRRRSALVGWTVKASWSAAAGTAWR